MSIRTIVKKFIPKRFFKTIEPFGHLLEAILFNSVYLFPARKFKVIGVTGTNGKTSTAFMIYKMLLEADYKVGLMTTVAYGAGKEIKPQIHHMTNVTVPDLMKRLKWMKHKNIEWLILETTSQALAQNRVWGVPYSIAVMTNVTHEHLDYHVTFERYRDAKRKLFRLTDKNHRGLRAGIVNAEDPSADSFVKDVSYPLTYGITKGDVRATDVKLLPDSLNYEVKLGEETLHIDCKLPGSFNVYNSLAAVCVGKTLGLSAKQIEQGIAALESVEGRMTRINEGQAFNVVVDYAHTPDSFEKLFKDMRPVIKGKMIVMFGSPGRRDEKKRAVQGELAGKYADEVILTEEDDRDIDGQEILDQIATGAESMGKVRGKDLFLVHDRTKAIAFSIGRAKHSEDTVLLLGKGHEKTIESANGENPWDEIGTAHQSLKDYLKSS
jgi:UDP-N-acetylmuramoyl-L-alanyl-D-glutamate--2,6-diaminopimelate ligase